jgi:hypothetical protein
MSNEKIDIPVKFNVSARMWSGIRTILVHDDYSLSEYMRELIRQDLRSRESDIVLAMKAEAEREG